MVWSELTAARWKLAKAAAIAGATVTAVPVVLPPIVIVSAFSLAFSVPSTILVAGYVCNEKLMTCLLSSPTPTDQQAQLELYLMYEEEEGKLGVVEEKKKKNEEHEKVVILPTSGQDGYDEVIRVCGSVEGSLIHEVETTRKEEEYENVSDKVMTLEHKTLVDRIDETDMGGTFEKHKYGNDQDISPSPKLQEVVMVGEPAIVGREVLVDEYRVDLSAHTFGNQLQHVDGDGEEGGVEVPADHGVHSSIATELKTSTEVLIVPADNLAANSPDDEVSNSFG